MCKISRSITRPGIYFNFYCHSIFECFCLARWYQGKKTWCFIVLPSPWFFFCFHEYNLVSSSDTENIMLMSALYCILGDFMSRIDFLWQCIQFSFSTLIFLDSSEFITQHQYTIEIGIIASWKIFSWCIIDMLLVLFNFSKVCQILEGV